MALTLKVTTTLILDFYHLNGASQRLIDGLKGGSQKINTLALTTHNLEAKEES